MGCVIYSSVYLQAIEQRPPFGKITEAEAILFQETAAALVLENLPLWKLE